jgi:hypothetical protein
MTAKLATVNDHILAGVEAPGAMDDRSIVPGRVSDKPQGRFMQFDSGYLSPYFVTDPERMEVAFENAYILIHEKQIGSKQDLLPLLEQITKAGKPLVIVAEDVQGEALATLVVKNLSGPLRVAAVRAPGSGDQRKKMLQRIATFTGGKAITEGPDIQLKSIKISDLGQAAKITIGKNNTVVEVRAGVRPANQNALNTPIFSFRRRPATTRPWQGTENLRHSSNESTEEFRNMNIFKHVAGLSRYRASNRSQVCLLSLALCFVAWPHNLLADQDQGAQAPAPPQDQQTAQVPPYTQQTPEQLQQLVAPIALYPDSLVAQILAASTFPDQVVEADRWVQAHPDLKGADLGKAVDQQPWDPSVKALAAFPSVLGNMDKNLSWASSLGDAYYNQQADVMNAVQVMRRRAQEAGNLKTTPQQTVATQNSDISIDPADPDEVYIPAYDPWAVYGGPVMAWPGWYPYPGIWFGGPYLSFGMGFGIGWYGGFGWGWNNWGFNWRGGYGLYGGGRYYSRSNTFYNRNSYYRGGGEGGVARNVQRGSNGTRGGSNARGGFNGERGGENARSGASGRAFSGNTRVARGYAAPRGQSGVRSGAFSGYQRGGQARSSSSRGSASMGGGARGGGLGGGGHAGGGHH